MLFWSRYTSEPMSVADEADSMISAGENDDFVLACTPEELVAATFACAFDEHLKRLADVAAVAFGGEFVLESNHTV